MTASKSSATTAALFETRIPVIAASMKTVHNKMLCQAWKRINQLLRNAGMNRNTNAGSSVKYAPAPTRRSAGITGFGDCPHSGQNAAPAGIEASQRGHAISCAGFVGSDEAPAIAFLAAIFADSVNLKGMSSGDVMMLASDLLLEFADFRREKFDRSAALRAHHVVMAAAIVLMLVAGDSVVERHFAGQSAICKQLQRAINGSESDVPVFFLDQLRKFVGRKVLAGFEKRAENRAALLRLLQAHPPQMPQEDALGLAHVFGRDAWLIVDSFLQHKEYEKRTHSGML
jgi:hypothetical protein